MWDRRMRGTSLGGECQSSCTARHEIAERAPPGAGKRAETWELRLLKQRAEQLKKARRGRTPVAGNFFLTEQARMN
jgi:hypothetical protein